MRNLSLLLFTLSFLSCAKEIISEDPNIDPLPSRYNLTVLTGEGGAVSTA